MATNNGPGETPPASGGLPPSVPAMPSVPPDRLYRGAPYVLAEDGRHSVGWQDARTAGPSFVVTTSKLGGFRTAVQRFPLSEQGWTDAWLALTRLDTSAAEAIELRLAQLDAGRRALDARVALDAGSLGSLRSVAFDGGSHRGSLTTGHYDLRFQDDEIMVCPAGSASAVIELPYADVEAVEVHASANQPASVALGLISGLGLVGALLGYLLLWRLGLLLGAVVFGLIGGLIAAVICRIETVVLVRQRNAQWQFHSAHRPDDVRLALSEPLVAIRQAGGARTNGSDRHADAPSSLADELGKLASLLQQDLITRDEFEQLKAKLIARP